MKIKNCTIERSFLLAIIYKVYFKEQKGIVMQSKKENKTGILLLVTASSGAGKTTIVERSLEQLQQVCPIERIITYTSKTPRATERDGIDYHFVTSVRFEELIRQNYFAEWSKTYEAYYGSPLSMIRKLEQGINCIVIVDREGAIALKQYYHASYIIMITPPSLEILEQRLRARNTENAEQIAKRVSLAKKEFAKEQAHKIADYYIENNDLELTIKHFVKCIEDLIGLRI